MRDLDSIKEINKNPEAFRKQQDKNELNNEITNLESRLKLLREQRDKEA